MVFFEQNRLFLDIFLPSSSWIDETKEIIFIFVLYVSSFIQRIISLQTLTSSWTQALILHSISNHFTYGRNGWIILLSLYTLYQQRQKLSLSQFWSLTITISYDLYTELYNSQITSSRARALHSILWGPGTLSFLLYQ